VCANGNLWDNGVHNLRHFSENRGLARTVKTNAVASLTSTPNEAKSRSRPTARFQPRISAEAVGRVRGSPTLARPNTTNVRSRSVIAVSSYRTLATTPNGRESYPDRHVGIILTFRMTESIIAPCPRQYELFVGREVPCGSRGQAACRDWDLLAQERWSLRFA